MPSIQWGFNPRLNQVKASGGCHRFRRESIAQAQFKIWTQLRRGVIDLNVIEIEAAPHYLIDSGAAFLLIGFRVRKKWIVENSFENSIEFLKKGKLK